MTPGNSGNRASVASSVERSASAAPSAGDTRTVSIELPTPMPWLAAIRHWLRTMLRWSGIIFVDHGVGWLRRSR